MGIAIAEAKIAQGSQNILTALKRWLASIVEHLVQALQ
jgi:hypothetical protein